MNIVPEIAALDREHARLAPPPARASGNRVRGDGDRGVRRREAARASGSTCTPASRRPASSACCATAIGSRAIGLRADLDALHIQEATGVAHASRHAGRMHACGHDGHTTMLLGAAKAMAQRRRFDGTVYFIFQPAEENEGGGRVMVEEGPVRPLPDGVGLRPAQLAAALARHVRDARRPADGRVRHLRDRRDRQGRARGAALSREGSDAVRRAPRQRAADDRRAQPPSAGRGRGQRDAGPRRRDVEHHPGAGRDPRHGANVPPRGAGPDRVAAARDRRRRRGHVRHERHACATSAAIRRP